MTDCSKHPNFCPFCGEALASAVRLQAAEVERNAALTQLHAESARADRLERELEQLRGSRG